MTSLAPNLSKFLNEHLPRDQRVSRHTIASYSLAFEYFVAFAAKRLKKRPIRLTVEQLTVPLILDFLDGLEKERDNAVRTRNLRLVAIKSFFRYLEFRAPACLELAQQVHAIPEKRFDRGVVKSLALEEVQAILDAPDTRTANGVRDRAMLLLCRGTEGVGARGTEVGRSRAQPGNRSRSGKRTAGTCASDVGNRETPVERVARDPTERPGPAPVPEQPRQGNDPARLRASPGSSRQHGKPNSAVAGREAGEPARPPAFLRPAHSGCSGQ